MQETRTLGAVNLLVIPYIKYQKHAKQKDQSRTINLRLILLQPTSHDIMFDCMLSKQLQDISRLLHDEDDPALFFMNTNQGFCLIC